MPDVQGFWSEHTYQLRVFEIFLVVVNLQALKFWYDHFRTKLTLGVLTAYMLAYGWAWFADLPFFLNMDFDPRFYGGYTFYGHWEPAWAGLGWTTLGLPLMHMMKNRESFRRFCGNSWAIYVVYWLGVSMSTTLMQLVFQMLGGMEYAYWKTEHLVFNIPWVIVFFMDPLMIMLPMFFIHHAEKLVAQVERQVPSKEGRIVKSTIESAWTEAGWATFFVGIAAVNSGLYFMFCLLIPMVAYVDPWTHTGSSVVKV